MNPSNVFTMLVTVPLFAGSVLVSNAFAADDYAKEDPQGGTLRTVVIKDIENSYTVRKPLTSAPTLRQRQELRCKKTARRALKTQKPALDKWASSDLVVWNTLARDLVARNKISPPIASRIYTLLSVAQHDTMVATWHNKYVYKSKAPLYSRGRGFERYSYPSEDSGLAGASSEVLIALFPQNADEIRATADEAADVVLYRGQGFRDDVVVGRSLGQRIAKVVLESAKTDRSDAKWTGTIPTGPGLWFSSAKPAAAPLLPVWGEVRPWFMTSGSQFRPSPPPAFGSPEFTLALQEVRQISDTRTDEQLAIAKFWSDGGGTYTPPGHWNDIASQAIVKASLNELRSAFLMSVMNRAIMDAGISCWDAKYTYWLIRPSQVDSAITVPVGLPNFPSYTSGHSAFSGAAGAVLGYFFPKDTSYYEGLSSEAAVSRLYGGIHYRFDSEVGLEEGRHVAKLAIEWAKSKSSEK